MTVAALRLTGWEGFDLFYTTKLAAEAAGLVCDIKFNAVTSVLVVHCGDQQRAL